MTTNRKQTYIFVWPHFKTRNKVYVKWQRSKSPRLREKLRTIRHKLQTQVRQAYWAYMETIIDFSSPTECPDDLLYMLYGNHHRFFLTHRTPR